MGIGFNVDVQESPPGRIQAVQEQLQEAAKEVQAGGRLPDTVEKALMQLLRFVLGNIEVDTGRTKNSIFPSVEGGGGNSVSAMLGTNVHYSPYVRDAGHRQQFFEYAAEKEGPRILAGLGQEVVVKVEGHFG